MVNFKCVILHYYIAIVNTDENHSKVTNCMDCDQQDEESIKMKPAAAVTLENDNSEKSERLI